MTSCSALLIENETPEFYFNYSPYDYDRVHYIYLNQPNYFQNTFYINQYGQQTYMYQHPHYVRYCRERDSRQRIESRKRPYVAPTVGRVNKTQYINRNNRRATSSTVRRTYTTQNSNNRTTQNSNNRTTSINRNATTSTHRNTTTRPTTTRRAPTSRRTYKK